MDEDSFANLHTPQPISKLMEYNGPATYVVALVLGSTFASLIKISFFRQPKYSEKLRAMIVIVACYIPSFN